MKRIACAALLAASITPFMPTTGAAVAASTDPCNADHRLDVQFDTGARWELCWYARERDGLVIESARYTTRDGRLFPVVARASLAQLHVAYDDSAVTYSDVTQYGLGGNWLQSLDDSDCRGRLLQSDGRNVACLDRADQDGVPELSLFSVSQVGAYVYIVTWRFGADGTFAPTIGASGALQRRSNDVALPFGRVLDGEPESLWLSHTHNYYWRIDLDLGQSGDDDIVTYSDYRTLPDGRRARQTSVLEREAAVRSDRTGMQVWHIRDTAPAEGRDPHGVPGYRLETPRAGHAFERPAVESWAGEDLFITVARDCERFASQNARFEPGCADDVAAFADDEAVQGVDTVLWQRIAFHHVPRNEDRRHMHTHWDGFRLTPDNLLARAAPLDERPAEDAPASGATSGEGSGGGGGSGLLLAVLGAMGWCRARGVSPNASQLGHCRR